MWTLHFNYLDHWPPILVQWFVALTIKSKRDTHSFLNEGIDKDKQTIEMTAQVKT